MHTDERYKGEPMGINFNKNNLNKNNFGNLTAKNNLKKTNNPALKPPVYEDCGGSTLVINVGTGGLLGSVKSNIQSATLKSNQAKKFDSNAFLFDKSGDVLPPPNTDKPDVQNAGENNDGNNPPPQKEGNGTEGNGNGSNNPHTGNGTTSGPSVTLKDDKNTTVKLKPVLISTPNPGGGSTTSVGVGISIRF